MTLNDILGEYSTDEEEQRDDSKGPFQLFLEDQEKVPPEDHIKWILMVGDALYDSEGGLDPATTEPFSHFYSKRGHRRTFESTKRMSIAMAKIKVISSSTITAANICK